MGLVYPREGGGYPPSLVYERHWAPVFESQVLTEEPGLTWVGVQLALESSTTIDITTFLTDTRLVLGIPCFTGCGLPPALQLWASLLRRTIPRGHTLEFS